jgi:hypothetical protein
MPLGLRCPGEQSTVNPMTPNQNKRAFRIDLLLAGVMVAAGLAVSGASLARLARSDLQMAQATAPLQSTPGAENKPSAPKEPITTGTRPMQVKPEPARPDADAQSAGAKSALPPAPAEKTAAPIREK